MERVPTEFRLINWREGQTQAERLAAAILALEGYAAIEPQAPLGGPDARADLLCQRAGKRFVGAVFFPQTEQSFRDVREKFAHDLKGVSRAGAHGIAFVTNQRLTLGQRKELHGIAESHGALSEIHDVERIRAALDSPTGYGVRLEYLGVLMNAEEQLSFAKKSDLEILLELARHRQTLDRLESDMDIVRHSVEMILPAVGVQQPRKHEPSFGLNGSITVDNLLMLHRGICSQIGLIASAGKFREVQVSLQPATNGFPSFVPVPPDDVPAMIVELLDWWNSELPRLHSRSDDDKFVALARFHHQFLAIHPFIDANGAVARELASQQGSALFSHYRFEIDNRIKYYAALRAADEGNLSPLTDLFVRTRE